ncbi:MAG: phosphatase PAP2 family protein [Nitrospira sp.]|nr:phosphatase PAP2 family protein [Nitrospira sp.]
MTSSGDPGVVEAHPSHMGSSSPLSLIKVWPFAAFGCSCAALALSFFGWAQFDLPVTKYVRSVTVHLPWDQLTIPWMAVTSNAGDWIGQGWRLALVSILLLAIAWVLEKPTIRVAAVQSLIAHGVAAVLANVLKHLIGRPRPKFVHSGDWQMAISWVSGLDSFPSGHSTASFAVATVLAKRFPLWGPSVPECRSFCGAESMCFADHIFRRMWLGARSWAFSVGRSLRLHSKHGERRYRTDVDMQRSESQ